MKRRPYAFFTAGAECLSVIDKIVSSTIHLCVCCRDGTAYTFGVVLNLLAPVVTVVIRSLLSKLVPKVSYGSIPAGPRKDRLNKKSYNRFGSLQHM